VGKKSSALVVYREISEERLGNGGRVVPGRVEVCVAILLGGVEAAAAPVGVG